MNSLKTFIKYYFHYFDPINDKILNLNFPHSSFSIYKIIPCDHLIIDRYPFSRHLSTSAYNEWKILIPSDWRNWSGEGLTAIKWRKINRTKRRDALTNRYAIGPRAPSKMSARQSEQPSQRYERLYRELRYRFFHSCLSVSRLIATPPPPAISSMALNVPPTYDSPPLQPTNHLLPSPSIRSQWFSARGSILSSRLCFFYFFSISFFLSSFLRNEAQAKKKISILQNFSTSSRRVNPLKFFSRRSIFPGAGKLKIL